MTRASLLHILDHVGSISEAENQELVQLATAFPYCQTAHLLLAKAAHDKGSMLASQRLRRAATYAADRQLLRLLIEQPGTVLPAASPTLPEPEQPAAEPQPLTPLPADEPAAAAELLIPAAAGPTPVEDEMPTPATDELSPPGALPPTDEETPAAEPTPTPAAAAPTPTPADSPADTGELPAAEATSATLAAAELPAAEETPVAPEATPETTAPEATTEQTETTVAHADAPTGPDDLLPAAAPPIRPPADAGSSRFEFGLADSLAPAPAVYELLDDTPPAALPPTRTATSPAFYADPTLGYGLDLGSRLGASLQSRDAYTTDLPPAEFFPPDALLLAHVEAHRPTLPAPQKTLAIIDQFLKKKPRLKAPPVAPPAEEQTDLSVPSTSPTPALASESLAKIMVKQGKTAKAIEIYERLMVRQPEKKAYFADQIAQLKSSE